jgi:hypothetical protein
MRAILVLSLAATTAIVSATAFAAGEDQDILKRRAGGGQEFVQPTVKPVGQTPRANPLVRPPVQTGAPPLKTQFAPPVGPKPPAPVDQVQQALPLNRQIGVEGPPPQTIAPAPAPETATTEPAEPTDTLQAEAPAAAPVAPPVEPKAAEKPADAQQPIEGDAAAAPKADEEAAPAEAPRTEPVKPREDYARDDDPQEDDEYFAEDDDGYQPRDRYSSYGYRGGYGGGNGSYGGYGSCE